VPKTNISNNENRTENPDCSVILFRPTARFTSDSRKINERNTGIEKNNIV